MKKNKTDKMKKKSCMFIGLTFSGQLTSGNILMHFIVNVH